MSDTTEDLNKIAKEDIEPEVLPIDEESGEIDYEKVNSEKTEKQLDTHSAFEAAVNELQNMSTAEILAMSITYGVLAMIIAFILLSIVAVITTLFASWLTLAKVFGIVTPILALLFFISKGCIATYRKRRS